MSTTKTAKSKSDAAKLAKLESPKTTPRKSATKTPAKRAATKSSTTSSKPASKRPSKAAAAKPTKRAAVKPAPVVDESKPVVMALKTYRVEPALYDEAMRLCREYGDELSRDILRKALRSYVKRRGGDTSL